MVRSLSKRRQQYAQRRLKQLRLSIPEMPVDILDRCSLRHLSVITNRCGGSCQIMLPPTSGITDNAVEPVEQPSFGPFWCLDAAIPGICPPPLTLA